jgi:hypothetical protein
MPIFRIYVEGLMADEHTAMVPAEAGNEGRDSAYIRAKITPLLMADEVIYAIAEQDPRYRWWVLPPDGAVVTSHRVLLLHCNLFSFRFEDFHWEHVEDIHIKVGFLGATVSVVGASRKTGLATQTTSAPGKSSSLNNLVKGRAQEVYKIGQEMEHKWREIVRSRAMEETRAAHGHYVTQAPTAAPQAGEPSPKERLRKLKELLDEELITPEEFEAKRAVVLAEV